MIKGELKHTVPCEISGQGILSEASITGFVYVFALFKSGLYWNKRFYNNLLLELISMDD